MAGEAVVPEFGQEYLFEDVFPDALAVFAGVKAVYSGLTHRYLCFSQNGATQAAKKAAASPWIICVGTGDVWNPADEGRVLSIAQMTTSHQKTTKFAANAEERRLYAQWPDAVAIKDVYEVIGQPHVMDDLGLKVHPLTLAFDLVKPLTPERLPILEGLKGYKLRLVDLPPLPAGVTLGTILPGSISMEEGRKVMKEVQEHERKSKISKFVKADNFKANGGAYVCEGCDFRHENVSLFDAHHKRPLWLGVQTTTPSDMAVLCPTCHRVVHHCVPHAYLPMEIPELRVWRTTQRRQ
jgi:5-methylcytosine-specific restriction protein A